MHSRVRLLISSASFERHAFSSCYFESGRRWRIEKATESDTELANGGGADGSGDEQVHSHAQCEKNFCFLALE